MPRLLLCVPCTEDHFQPIKGFLRPWFRPSITLCSTRPFPTPVAQALPQAALGGQQPKNGVDFTAWRKRWYPYSEPPLYKGQKIPPGHCWTELSNFCTGVSRPTQPGIAQPMVEFSFVFPFKKYQQKKKKNPVLKQPEQRGPFPLPMLCRAPQKGTTWLRPCLQLVMQGC